jgi:phosphonopyruvate decarboxylase
MLVGIPDKILVKWLGKKDYIKPADEGEDIGIACGHYIATGKRATVFMSADGFCNALNPITSLVIPENIKMNLVISTGREEPQHIVMTKILSKVLKALNYDPTSIDIKIITKE